MFQLPQGLEIVSSIEGNYYYNCFLLDFDSVSQGWRLTTSALGDSEATHFFSILIKQQKCSDSNVIVIILFIYSDYRNA